MDAEDLIAEAEKAARSAYAPYSGFAVGAVAVTEDGRRFRAANVENAAFPSSLCAEAVAIGSAVAAGYRRIVSVAVASGHGGSCHPCGNCRQIMSEFDVRDLVARDSAGSVGVYRLAELPPRAFEAANLEHATDSPVQRDTE